MTVDNLTTRRARAREQLRQVRDVLELDTVLEELARYEDEAARLHEGDELRTVATRESLDRFAWRLRLNAQRLRDLKVVVEHDR